MEQDNIKKSLSLNNSVIEALVSGSVSSMITTVIYQPLELLKTRMQLRDSDKSYNVRIFGRLREAAVSVTKSEGVRHLWQGTGASLMRSGPGVGLYYALLNILQTNFSAQNHKPDSASQAFYFGLTARSLVSFVLLPVTVVKVRYESGQFVYPSLARAIQSAYMNLDGWVGILPTILRDSLFSGTYYMCYTKLKNETNILYENVSTSSERDDRMMRLRNFSCGITSGLVASIVTNPIDVVKTNIQTFGKGGYSSFPALEISRSILTKDFTRFFDGLVPRSLRRTLVAATTWTIYELTIDTIKRRP